MSAPLEIGLFVYYLLHYAVVTQHIKQLCCYSWLHSYMFRPLPGHRQANKELNFNVNNGIPLEKADECTLINTTPCWPDDGRVTAETCSRM